MVVTIFFILQFTLLALLAALTVFYFVVDSASGGNTIYLMLSVSQALAVFIWWKIRPTKMFASIILALFVAAPTLHWLMTAEKGMVDLSSNGMMTWAFLIFGHLMPPVMAILAILWWGFRKAPVS